MDNMNTNLDGLYYRTSATPSLCGPYKTVTNYNGCSAAQGQKTQAFSRTDFKRDDQANAKMISASDQSKYRQILQYPKSLADILGSKEEQLSFIKKFPNLETVLKPLYPKLFAEGYAAERKPLPKTTRVPRIPTSTSFDINSTLLQGSLGNTNEGYSRPACSSCRSF